MLLLKFVFSLFYTFFSIIYILSTQLNNPKSREENIIISCMIIVILLYLFTFSSTYGFLSLPVLCMTSVGFMLGSYAGFKPIFRSLTYAFGNESREKNGLSNYVIISFLSYFSACSLTFIFSSLLKSNLILELFDVWGLLFTSCNFIFIILYLSKYKVFTEKIIFVSFLTICFAMGLFDMLDIIIVYSNSQLYTTFNYAYDDPTMIIDIIWNTLVMFGVMILPRLGKIKEGR